MTPHQSPESTRSVYDTCDPKYLRQLREAAGMDLLILARTACLSLAQVRQLESDDSDNLFYSDAIKRQAYKRLLMILGAEPPTVDVPEELRDAEKVAEAHLHTLDQIVAMSHQPPMNRTTSDVLRAGVAQLVAHQQVLGALLLLVFALVLFALHGPQEAAPSRAVAVSAQTLPKPELVAPVATPAVVAPTVAVPAATQLASTSTACAYANDAMPELTPFVARKEGRYVYLVSSANVEICVVDGNKQATTLDMKAGENRSVHGVPPWQLSGAQLQKVQIYFQGGRVSLPEGATHRVKLVEVPVTR